MLHPEIDNPSDFLGVELDPKGEGLKLVGTDGTNERGERTIQICNLNRVDLKINRLRKLEDFIAKINLPFILLRKDLLSMNDFGEVLEVIFDGMDNQANSDKEEHTLLLRSAVTNTSQFSSLVLPRLEVSQQAIVLAVFTEYRALNPF